jgi:hypothetical protein
MQSRQLALSTKNATLRSKPIELPKSPKVEPIKDINADIQSNEISSAMCNFDPIMTACTPPDGYFMHNLHARMDKMQSAGK